MSASGQNRKSSMRAYVFRFAPESGRRATWSACPFRGQQQTFVFELHQRSGSPHPRIWYSSLADLTTRIDPYSIIIGSARRSEFQSKLAGPLEGLRRITRRERHGSGYVRKASASRGGKHR